MNIQAYWWKAANFGDTLTPHIFNHFLKEEIEYTQLPGDSRLIGIGSIAHHAKPGDIIVGSGSNRPGKQINGSGITVLSLRGPLTQKQIVAAENKIVPTIYGDPALLLPLVYQPKNKQKTHKIGYLPHYVDKPIVSKFLEDTQNPEYKMIDIQKDWRDVIDEIVTCDTIVTSSLHGIIAAEAYGIPVIWTKYSEKIIGGDYKFDDYFLGTGRKRQTKDVLIQGEMNLLMIQDEIRLAITEAGRIWHHKRENNA